MGRAEISERIKELYEEVRSETKTKVKEEPEKDQPKLRERPQSSSAEKKKRRKKAKGQPVIEGPVVTLKDIAFDHNMSPKDLRRILRRSDIKRPGGRWEWPEASKEVKKIKKLLKKGESGTR